MDGAPIILFDGECNLCNGAVDFVLRRDREGGFRFASQQSAVARELLARRADLEGGGETIILIEDDAVHLRSTAALRIARRLSWPWSMAWALRFVPRRLRDWIYDGIARRRYRWFGRRPTCRVPEPELAGRFLG